MEATNKWWELENDLPDSYWKRFFKQKQVNVILYNIDNENARGYKLKINLN